MAVIETYQEKTVAQGQTDTRNNRATGADFGAGVGQAISNLGSGVEAISDELQKQKEQEDVTNAHILMAKKEAEWTQRLVDEGNKAKPGDSTFAPRMIADVKQDLSSTYDQNRTLKGAALYTGLSSQLEAKFGTQAIHIQAELDGKAAVNSYNDLILNLAKTANTDPTQYQLAYEKGRAAINDPNGIFAKVSQARRDELTKGIENNIAMAAAQGFVRKDPTTVLGSFSPEILDTFKPVQKVLDMNKAPGANVTISPETMKVAPDVISSAAKYSINPNIILAQIDADGIGHKDPKADVANRAQIMSTLVNSYGGDYTKALAASKIGVMKLQSTMEQWGTDWQNHLPAGTNEYVDKILSNSGTVSSPDNPPNQARPSTNANTVTQTPATSKLDFMNKLTYVQQDQIVDKAVQLQHLKLTMDNMAQAKQEHDLKLEQDTVMKDFYKQIIDPKANGIFSPIEVISNQTLTQAQQQHLIDTALAHTRAKGESKAHPEEVNRLMKRIIADSDDPTKILTSDAVRDSLKLGRLNASEFVWLDNQVNQIRDGEGGGSLQKQVKLAYRNIEDSFMKDFTATAIPGGAAYAADATMRMRIALDDTIKQYRKEGKDVRTLFDPDNKDYFLSDSNKKTYMPKAMQIMSDSAGKVVNQEARTLPTYKDYDKLKKGESYLDDKNNIRTKQ